jgi:hypothetical protein
VTLLAAAHVATLACWTRPLHVVAKAKANAPVAAEHKAAPAAPAASIEWRSPESETSATAIEEVPLEALADSSTGLRNLVLEVEVNGKACLAKPLTDDLTKPGPHPIKPSIYLDQLGVKTYDMVSYHLGAQRIAGSALPPTVSPVQFVQIKPVREDTFVCAGGDQPSKCFNYVTALKAAQLHLMKDNFTLAHAEVGHDSSEWRDENTRVGSDQNQLADRTAEVIDLMTTNNYPAQILGLVRQSRPLMADAGGKIVHQENQPALQPQGQALAYLTEVEKYLKSKITLASKSQQPKAADPFQSKKNLDLKTHPLTRAGKVDELAKAQSELAGDLAGGSTNATARAASADRDNPASDVAGTPGDRQLKIKDHIGEFLNDPGFQSDALKHLQSSDDLAGQSRERIVQNDLVAASEPAAEAARELRQTAAALRAGGEQAAKNQLADALLQLAAAAGNARLAPQAKTDAQAIVELKKTEDAVREAAQRLAAEAQRLREDGATNAAARLEAMAKMLQGDTLKQMLAQAQAAPRDAAQAGALAKKLDELAERAGQQRNAGPMSRQELARLSERMQRAQANVKNLASQFASQCSNPSAAAAGKPAHSSVAGNAGGGGGVSYDPAHARSPEPSADTMRNAEAQQLLDELRLDSADAVSGLGKQASLQKLDDLLRAAAASPPPGPDDYTRLLLQIDDPLAGVINTLQTQLAKTHRQFQVASTDNAGALPAYRDAVADYFEQVSRDYQPDKNESGDAH